LDVARERFRIVWSRRGCNGDGHREAGGHENDREPPNEVDHFFSL
jgi:hypothetical protein